MPPTVEDRLRDILEAITDIENAVQDFTFDQFVAEKTTRLAIERLLEIVCEASRFIPDDVKRARDRLAQDDRLRKPATSCLSHDEGRDRLGDRSNPPSIAEILR